MASTCRSCSAAIVWAQTINGKQIPVDHLPVANGNVDLVSHSDPREAPIAHMLDATGQRDVDGLRRSPFLRYVSHFSTCPDAARHRKPTP